MNERVEELLCELIGAAGAARSSYISAIQAAKSGEGDPEELVRQGDEYFQQAHEFHHDLLTLEGDEDSAGVPVTMFLVHVEDQFMCAETFRILAGEFIDLYKGLKG